MEGVKQESFLRAGPRGVNTYLEPTKICDLTIFDLFKSYSTDNLSHIEPTNGDFWVIELLKASNMGLPSHPTHIYKLLDVFVFYKFPKKVTNNNPI